jgi:Uncharacterized protein conserved in bacteria
MSKIGIPRAMYYYRYFPMWKTFFEELGAEVVVSQPTSKKTLDEGSKYCVDEACLAVKLYMGHVENLKHDVDYIFIPRFTSISKREYICPKFGGLPDMVRRSIPNLPTIIDTEVNMYKSQKGAFSAAVDAGGYISNDPIKITRAYKKAQQEYDFYRDKLKMGFLPDEIFENRVNIVRNSSKDSLNIAVIGHEYNLYDGYFNMDLLKKLKGLNVNVTTIEMMNEEKINEKAARLDKKMFWSFGRTAVGTALEVIERKNIDGIIYLMTFGCGVDSFVSDFIERKVRNHSNVPFTVLTIDEHTGEAGLDTRIEAFIDMIRWRYSHDSNISAHG